MIRDRIGKYKIESWIGGGAFADVFLGYDTITQKRYALKISRQKQKDIEMLMHEARLLASLEHPNIVRFYNADIIDGRLVLVMEYVDGPSLRRLIDEKAPMELNEALQLILQILSGLEYAHSHGVIHRDIKPENVLLTPENIPKITDFGLGVFFSGEHLSISVAGTPIYMPPESWKGEFRQESDIWSVAAVLYEMLSGRPPFFDESLDGLRRKIMSGKLSRIPGVPTEVFDVLKKALHRNPERRFHSASEFRSALTRNARGQELVLLQVQAPGRGEPKALRGLTHEQAEAVRVDARTVLLIGGAGTGKTTTLAHRIAYLIDERGVSADRIVAVTFTGKAASELKARVEHLIGEGLTKSLWTGTFHLLGHRIISYGAERFGLPEDVVIIGRDEALKIAVSITGQTNINRLKGMLREVSLAKSRLITPEKYEMTARSRWQQSIAAFYRRYEDYKTEHGLIDYDDMIFLAIRLLFSYEDIREMFLERFDHILVDEFQDINHAQYQLIRFLTMDEKGVQRTSLYVTGDDDQSIYGFRGASKDYLYRLKEDFPDVVELRLTRNFRSPAEIINLAETLISHNTSRIKKVIVPHRERHIENPVVFYAASDESDEAAYVADRILKEHESGIAFEDMAVIMRMNSYSRAFEDTFSRKHIPYNLPGSGGFWDRPEVRDAVGLLRLLIGEGDKASLSGVLRRFLGFSKKEASAAVKYFDKTGRPTFSKTLPPDKLELLKKFWELLLQRRGETEVMSPSDFLEEVFGLSGYLEKLGKSTSTSKEMEQEYILELLNIAGSFGRGGIRQFLSHVAISKELGYHSQSTGGVQIMSIHSAKGLEFPIVFLVGMAEGIFPSSRSIAEPAQLEEERRLCFVAVTRALERLYITYPKRRFRRYQEPSRFLYEMYVKE